MLIVERFSSRGLAGAYADYLALDGVEATVTFKPRGHADPQPFFVRRASRPSAPQSLRLDRQGPL